MILHTGKLRNISIHNKDEEKMILTKVTGTTFGGRQNTIRELIQRGILGKDAIVELHAEPDCKFDKNARRCVVKGYTIGYLDKEVSEIMEIMHKRGTHYIGVVDWIGSYNGDYGIRVAIRKMGE